MTTTPGYEEFTDHKECNAKIVELEEENNCLRERLKECEEGTGTSVPEMETLKRKLGEIMKALAEKDRILEEKNRIIEELKKKPGTNWMEQIKAFFVMLDEKRYGPIVEHGLSILAGSLLGYGIK